MPVALIRADGVAQLPAALAAVTAALAHELGAMWRAGPWDTSWAMPWSLGWRDCCRTRRRCCDWGCSLDAPVQDVPSARGRAYAGPLRPEWDAAAYAARFGRVKDYIAAGEVYQANLSFRARFAFLGEARALYEQLLSASGAAHCAFIDDEERQILSLSPELFFDVAADGVLTVRPMKGTLARGGDDAAERARLASSAKDRAENLMIVDLIRNDLSRIAEGGSVAVRDLFQVETYPTLHAMVSTITAAKRKDAGVADILRALFPCGSVTGAPKIRAMEILHELESSPRGAYCGAVGYFAPAPNNQFAARFNVAIRTLILKNGRGQLGIGGGVVQDSTSDGEYAECLLKAQLLFEKDHAGRWN